MNKTKIRIVLKLYQISINTEVRVAGKCIESRCMITAVSLQNYTYK